MFACFRIADGYASGDIGSCGPDSLPQIVPTRVFAQTKQTLAATLLIHDDIKSYVYKVFDLGVLLSMYLW